MCITGPLEQRTVAAVLLSLWRRSAQSASSRGDVSIQHILQDTLAPLPDVQFAIEELRRRRCIIEQTPSGIRLISAGLSCWSEVLEQETKASAQRIGRRVMIFQRTASTNDIAWQGAGDSDSDGLVVIADDQTAGRGRFGHQWDSKPGQSILFSVLLQQGGTRNAGMTPPTAEISIDRLTLLTGLAVAEAIEAALAEAVPGGSMPRIGIKWPNDLIVENKKLAGVLIESRQAFSTAGGTREHSENCGHVVIGIGINVAQSPGDFPAELKDRAISLYGFSGVHVDRLMILRAVLNRLNMLLAGGREGADDSTWINAWKSRCAMLGKRIKARAKGGSIIGQVLDVDPLQGLVVRDDAGATHFLSGQTTSIE